MLEGIIKSLTPELVLATIQANPGLVPSVLQKFDAFVAFGQALTTEQQIYLSANASKLGSFLKQADVKEAIGILANAFINKTSQEASLPTTKPTK